MPSQLAYTPSISIKYHQSRPNSAITFKMFCMAYNSSKGKTTDAGMTKGSDDKESMAPSSAAPSSSEGGDGHSRSSSATVLSESEEAQIHTERLISGLKASARSNNEAAAPSMPRLGLNPHASAFLMRSAPVNPATQTNNGINDKYAKLSRECQEKGDFQGMVNAIVAGNSDVQRSVDKVVAVAEKENRDREHMTTLFQALRASNTARPWSG